MDLDLVLLGTAASAPTAQRAPAALLVRRGGERLLVDCAEGTQRQLLRSQVGLPELTDIFLTHFHADHILGLPGLLKTFALRGRDLPLAIHGPPGLERTMATLRAIYGRLSYPVQLVELEPGDSLRRDGYELRAFALDHGVAAIGYALVEDERPGRFDPAAADRLGVPNGPARGALQHGQAVTLDDGTRIHPREVVGETRPGRKLVLAGDTAPSAAVVAAAEGADVLVHEATFSEEERERAVETRHSTALDAARVGLAAGVKLLVLTHLSGRYFGPEIAREARAVFPATVVPRDFDVIAIPFPERGGPELVKGGAAPEEGARRPEAAGDGGAAGDLPAEPSAEPPAESPDEPPVDGDPGA